MITAEVAAGIAVVVLIAFAVGIGASMLGDRRDPEGAAERRATA